MNFNKRFVLLLVFLVFGLFVFYILVLSNIGKTKVELFVAPTESIVSIDGRVVKGSSVHLEPGTYEFSAKFTAFEEAREAVEVGNDSIRVTLLPEPVSERAKAFLISNPKEQALREEYGGSKAAEDGELFRNNNDIVNILPRIDITGPYAIDYGRATTDDSRAILVIRDSSPKGRQKALEWLREQGFDPVDYEIVFDGYTNIFDKYSEGE